MVRSSTLDPSTALPVLLVKRVLPVPLVLRVKLVPLGKLDHVVRSVLPVPMVLTVKTVPPVLPVLMAKMALKVLLDPVFHQQRSMKTVSWSSP